MTFTNMANTYYVPATMKNPEIGSVFVDNFRSRMRSTTENVDIATNKVGNSFGQTLLKAFDMMNDLQVKSADLGKQALIDPESVEAHDITIAMGKASLSLKLAQTVIDRVVKSWNDVTTTR
ncbi:MAG: flagellar hook-basal body complex protein FliE [Treponema sp.]|nr:MAG: flagellar hook-basal body complex protein FliE [Treponema sp.]